MRPLTRCAVTPSTECLPRTHPKRSARYRMLRIEAAEAADHLLVDSAVPHHRPPATASGTSPSPVRCGFWRDVVVSLTCRVV